MNNNSIIESLNNLINIAVGYGMIRADGHEAINLYKNDLVNKLTILLDKLGIGEDYKVIDTSKNNVIPFSVQDEILDEIWTDYVIVTKEIKNKIQEEKEMLVLKTNKYGIQELWKRII